MLENDPESRIGRCSSIGLERPVGRPVLSNKTPEYNWHVIRYNCSESIWAIFMNDATVIAQPAVTCMNFTTQLQFSVMLYCST